MTAGGEGGALASLFPPTPSAAPGCLRLRRPGTSRAWPEPCRVRPRLALATWTAVLFAPAWGLPAALWPSPFAPRPVPAAASLPFRVRLGQGPGLSAAPQLWPCRPLPWRVALWGRGSQPGVSGERWHPLPHLRPGRVPKPTHFGLSWATVTALRGTGPQVPGPGVCRHPGPRGLSAPPHLPAPSLCSLCPW